MLLRRFELHRPTALDGVFDVLDRHGEQASVYAGGTELLVALKARVLHYGHLIDLKGLSGLATIGVEGDSLVIGALATHHRIAHDPLVQGMAPSYARLSGDIANIRVRCAGTIGGNLCFAEPHADPPPLLAALGARVRLESPSGRRECGMDEFVRGAFETERRGDEIMTAVIVPRAPARTAAAYARSGHLERPAVGAAAAIRTDGRICSGASLRLGAIGAGLLRLPETESALAGLPLEAVPRELSERAAAEVATIEAADDLHGSADYKRHLAVVLLRRVVAAALSAAHAPEGTP